MARQREHGTGSLYKRGGRGVWIASFFDHKGKRRQRSTGTTDRAAANRILSKLIADAALRRSGVVDPTTDRYAEQEGKPIKEHWTDWKATLTATTTRKHADTTAGRARRILAAIRIEYLSGLNPSDVQAAIAQLRDDGLSLQSCQHYLRAIKQSSRWLRRDGRLWVDTLQHLEGFNTAADRQYERRAMDADELRRLIDRTETAPPWRGLTGRDRAMLYRIAAGTGFRASERAIVKCR